MHSSSRTTMEEAQGCEVLFIKVAAVSLGLCGVSSARMATNLLQFVAAGVLLQTEKACDYNTKLHTKFTV